MLSYMFCSLQELFAKQWFCKERERLDTTTYLFSTLWFQHLKVCFNLIKTCRLFEKLNQPNPLIKSLTISVGTRRKIITVTFNSFTIVMLFLFYVFSYLQYNFVWNKALNFCGSLLKSNISQNLYSQPLKYISKRLPYSTI